MTLPIEVHVSDALSLTAAAPLVIGLDLSITRTGIAGADWTSTIRTEKRAGGIDDDLRRITKVRTDVLDLVRKRGAELIVVEGPSYASQGAGHHTLAGLWWAVVGGLREWGYPVAVATPSALKKYGSGKGNAAKSDVLVAVTRRFLWFAGTADEADALVLCAMGCDHLGHPLVVMPAVHREALVKVAWPGDQR